MYAVRRSTLCFVNLSANTDSSIAVDVLGCISYRLHYIPEHSLDVLLFGAT